MISVVTVFDFIVIRNSRPIFMQILLVTFSRHSSFTCDSWVSPSKLLQWYLIPIRHSNETSFIRKRILSSLLLQANANYFGNPIRSTMLIIVHYLECTTSRYKGDCPDILKDTARISSRRSNETIESEVSGINSRKKDYILKFCGGCVAN